MTRYLLKKYLAHNDKVLVYFVDATNMVADARNLHFLSNVATAALGRTM
ncbi:MAG: Hsp33 family molecular chaperone HslO, partial [Paraprevotella sp.]|nr:Hsp33 family molecular chaperone HslO [Paraprevotella sp.]